MKDQKPDHERTRRLFFHGPNVDRRKRFSGPANSIIKREYAYGDAKESNSQNKRQGSERVFQNIDLVDAIIPWLLIAFGIIAVIGAILRTVIAYRSTVRPPMLTTGLDSTTLLYLVVGGVLLLMRQVKTLTFGGYKLEMLERVTERQEDQIEGILRLILPVVLTQAERTSEKIEGWRAQRLYREP